MPLKAIWPVLVCEECLSEFSVMPYRKDTAKYCSLRCGQRAKARKSSAVIIEKYRGTGTIGYVKENGRHQHRIAAENKIGRALHRNEIVHHVDGNKHNNHPSNLEVMTQSQHVKIHVREMLAIRKLKAGFLC